MLVIYLYFFYIYKFVYLQHHYIVISGFFVFVFEILSHIVRPVLWPSCLHLQVLGLQVCTTIPGSASRFLIVFVLWTASTLLLLLLPLRSGHWEVVCMLPWRSTEIMFLPICSVMCIHMGSRARTMTCLVEIISALAVSGFLIDSNIPFDAPSCFGFWEFSYL